MSLIRTVEPEEEPVSLTEAKRNSRVEITEDDDDITDTISEARNELEEATARAFITQTWELTLDRFPYPHCDDACRPNSREILLKVCPVQSVTDIVYTDPAGDEQTLSTDIYNVDVKSEPARITLKPGQTWPTTIVAANAVTITFVAGYGDAAAAVPRIVKRAIKMRVQHWYSYRGIATDAKFKAGETAWESLKKLIGWGTYP